MENFDVYYRKRDAFIAISNLIGHVVHKQFYENIDIVEWSDLNAKVRERNITEIDVFDDNFKPLNIKKTEIFDIMLTRLTTIEKNYNQLLNDLGYEKYLIVVVPSGFLPGFYMKDSFNNRMDKYYMVINSEKELNSFLQMYHHINF